MPILPNKSLLRENEALITGYYEIQKGPYSSLLHHRTIDICVDSAKINLKNEVGDKITDKQL